MTHTQVLVPNEQTTMNLDKLRVKKFNKTQGHMLIGEVIMHREINDDLQFVCQLFKKAGNDYKLLPYKTGPNNFCEYLNGEKLLYPEIQASSDLPENCPWPAATYHIFGYQPDFSKMPPVFNTGDYMLECQIRKDEKMLNGIKVFGNVLSLPFQ